MPYIIRRIYTLFAVLQNIRRVFYGVKLINCRIFKNDLLPNYSFLVSETKFRAASPKSLPSFLFAR